LATVVSAARDMLAQQTQKAIQYRAVKPVHTIRCDRKHLRRYLYPQFNQVFTE